MNISSLIFDGVNGQSAVLNTDTIPVTVFETHVDTRRDAPAKVAGHGSWPVKTWMGERTFHYEGFINAPDPGTYMQSRLQIMGAITPVPELGYFSVGTLRMMIDGISEEIQAVCDVTALPDIPVEAGYPSSSDFMIEFVSSDPFCYSTNINTFVTGTPVGGAGGLTFPIIFPIQFTGTGTGGDINVTNAGNVLASPTVLITGPCTNPGITIVLPNGRQTVAFTDLVLGASESVTLDFAGRTAITNSGGSVYHKIVPGSSWWRVPNGTWPVAYFAGNASAPSHAEIQLRNPYNI